jgi:hypothetical protein
VVLFCLSGAALSLNFFRLDLFSTIRHLTLEPVGTITFRKNTAQRRLADRTLWDRLRQDAPVYPGDLIRTADISEAKVFFEGGSGSLNLNDNTLIQIQSENGRPRIDLSEGGLSLNSPESGGGGLVINAGGSRIEVEAGTALSAETASSGGMVLRVSEGSAVISNGEGRRAARAGEVVSMDASGTERMEPAALVYYPRPNARYVRPGREATEIAFSWNRVNIPEEEPVRLDLAEDRNFSRITWTGENSGVQAAAEVVPGVWYWRLSLAAGEGAAPLATGKFTVIYAPPPALITPVEGYVYRYRTRLPGVRFQWTETEGAVSYLLEAASDPGFGSPQFTGEIRGTAHTVSSLGPGTWFWRVRPLFPEGFEGLGAVSAVPAFRIEQAGELEAPPLQSPGAEEFVNIAAGRGDCFFSWKPGDEAESYTIRISPNEDLRDPVITRTVRDNFYVYGSRERVLGPGRYYWAVYQTDGEGNDSPSSPRRPFTALEGEMIQRAVFPPENYRIAENLLPDIRFTWKTNLPFETRFQISAAPDFSLMTVDERAAGGVFEAPALPPGVWYWRIAADTAKTPARRFTVAAALPAPEMVQPAPGERVIHREGEPPYVFRWEPVEGADFYQFRLYAGQDRGRPVYELTMGENLSQPVSLDRLSEGACYWTLRAIALETPSGTRQAGLLGEETFTLRKPRPLALESPRPGTRFDGFQALRGDIALRWNSAEPVKNVRLILSRDPGPPGGTPVQEIRNPGRAVSLPPLDEGAYYWTVIAESEDGFDLSPPAAFSFTVQPISLLPEPGNRSPPAGTTIGPEDLRGRRNIAFRWSPVPGADGYIFTLFKETARGRERVFQNGPDSRTAWTLEDLTILDRGAFVWQVEAVGTGAGGLVEQRGRPGENTLILDFPLPGRIRTGEPGTMYGR